MGNNIILQTEGYEVTFEFKRFPNYTTSLDLTVHFLLDSELGKVEAQSIPMPTTLGNLRTMIKYLEQHIADLQKDPDTESYTFVPFDLHFQLQASAGEVRSLDDGEFTLRVMVNVGKPVGKISSVYVGGETMVTLENINHFIAALRSLIAETSSS